MLGSGGVFHNYEGLGLVHGYSALPLGDGYSFEAKLCAAMYAVKVAWSKGWSCLWLKSYLTYVVHLFRSRSSRVSWNLVLAWLRNLHLVSLMDFHVSHIFREANGFVDRS